MDFPKRMRLNTNGRNSGIIVSFSASGVGEVIAVPDYATYNIGHHSTDWAMECFEDIDYSYPRRMRIPDGRSAGTIVEFQSYGCGVVVFANPSSTYSVGYHSAGWQMNCFEDIEQSEQIIASGYPKIMEIRQEGHACEGLTVLFSKEGVGTVLHPGNSFNIIGIRHEQWNMNGFTDVQCRFRISNELIHPPKRLIIVDDPIIRQLDDDFGEDEFDEDVHF